MHCIINVHKCRLRIILEAFVRLVGLVIFGPTALVAHLSGRAPAENIIIVHTCTCMYPTQIYIAQLYTRLKSSMRCSEEGKATQHNRKTKPNLLKTSYLLLTILGNFHRNLWKHVYVQVCICSICLHRVVLIMKGLDGHSNESSVSYRVHIGWVFYTCDELCKWYNK